MKWLAGFSAQQKVLASVISVFVAGVVCAFAINGATQSHAQTQTNRENITDLLEYQRGELERQKRELEAEQRAKAVVAAMCRSGETKNRARCEWAGVPLPGEN